MDYDELNLVYQCGSYSSGLLIFFGSKFLQVTKVHKNEINSL